MSDFDDQGLLQAMEEEQALCRFLFVPRDSAEWDYMWDRLAKHYVNEGQEHPTSCYNDECGEVWQYMGTVRRHIRLFHEFRHRCHPGSGHREYLRLPASERLAVLGDRLVEYL